MTGWLIAGGILLLLAGLLFTPAVLHLTLQDNAPPVIRLSFLGIPLYRSDRKQPTAKRSVQHKKKRTKKQKSASQKKKQSDTESRSLSEWFDLLHDALSSIRKGLRRLTKSIRFRHVSIYIGVRLLACWQQPLPFSSRFYGIRWNENKPPRNSPERLFRIFPCLLHNLFSYTQILHIGGFSHAGIQFQTI